MRMRRMKNLESRMENCAELRITNPADYKGNWRSLKEDATALWEGPAEAKTRYFLSVCRKP